MERCIVNKKNDLQAKILNFFIPKGVSLKVALEVIEAKVESANDFKELLNMFEFIRSSNFKFKNERLDIYHMYFVGCICFLGLALFGTSMIVRASSKVIGGLLLVTFAFTFVAIVKWNLYSRKKNHTKQISDSISLKKVALDNNLEFDKSNKKELMQSFGSQFFIFQQGNYSREIKRYIKGEHENKFVYHYFNLHYVNEDTSTSTDSNGNKTSSTTYSHYDLYGIIIPFSTKNFIKISNYEAAFKFRKFIKWNTSSLSFNKKFKVYTDNEQAVAVFLQPKVIEQIEEIYQTFPKLDIELSSLGLLTLTTPDKELLNYNRSYGVDQLDCFKEEIKQVLDQTKLHKALGFVNFLKEYHEQT